MPEDDEVDALTRRHFLKLSGMVGAATVLAGASPVGWRNPAAAAVTNPDCGDPGDSVKLWQKAHGCYLNPKPKTAACPAEAIDSNPKPEWVVLNGGDHTGSSNTQDFLLVPTDRIKGIECSKIWQSNDPNYWFIAWEQSQTYVNPTHNLYRALGINSKGARGQDQLHIHMTALRPEALQDLENKDRDILKVPLSTWKDPTVSGVKVRGKDKKTKAPNSYTYRVIHLPDLKQNLFELLYNHVADVKLREDMAEQILIVAPRQKSGEGFYILNSQAALLGGGTSTCDHLLVYQG